MNEEPLQLEVGSIGFLTLYQTTKKWNLNPFNAFDVWEYKINKKALINRVLLLLLFIRLLHDSTTSLLYHISTLRNFTTSRVQNQNNTLCKIKSTFQGRFRLYSHPVAVLLYLSFFSILSICYWNSHIYSC